jgi:hypothetical protein
MRIPARLGVTILIAALTACSDYTSPLEKAGIAKCPTGTAILTVSPIALTSITGWVPLGNLNPPAHTFPTDHQYLYYSIGTPVTAPIPLVAPAAMYVSRAKRSTYSTGQRDYSIEFQPCAETKGEFGHVATLTFELDAAVGAFDQNCNTYSPNPGLTVTQCSTKNVAVKLAAGDPMGFLGSGSTSLALDFSFWDSRVTPIVFANTNRWFVSPDGFDRYHVVPASDYYTEPMTSQVAAKLGSFDGATKRTIAPLGGTIAADSTGIQGHWFVTGQPTFPESPHLAIARDNVDPRRYVISIGTSQPGFGGGSFIFTPQATGIINLEPSAVVATSGIVCYQPQNGSVILISRLTNLLPWVIRVERRAAASTCVSQQPYAFTAGATVDYSQ